MFVSLSIAAVLLNHFAQSESAVVRSTCPGTVVLPMLQTQRQSPLIELEIGGKKFKFTLDTGAVGGRVSPEIIKMLHLKPEGMIRVGDPSGKNSREVGSYRIPQIKAGGATLYGVRMMESAGIDSRDTEGVIGYAAFSGMLLTLDYPNRQVVLTPGGMSKAQFAKSIPYRLEHGLPTLTVQVGKVSLDGHVDSGSDGGLSIPSKYKAALNLDGEPRLVGHARTMFNSFDIYLAKVKDPVLVGGMKMPIDEVEIQDIFPFSNIGGRLLKKFKVTIDQKQHRILFETA